MNNQFNTRLLGLSGELMIIFDFELNILRNSGIPGKECPSGRSWRKFSIEYPKVKTDPSGVPRHPNRGLI